ncbi:MAG TPA: hypothetical protein VLW17_02640 [Thermoanaerobaculaceae bacterium]|nr:hypothetical protein [Thermoanaerobaculaceae bacterium]
MTGPARELALLMQQLELVLQAFEQKSGATRAALAIHDDSPPSTTAHPDVRVEPNVDAAARGTAIDSIRRLLAEFEHETGFRVIDVETMPTTRYASGRYLRPFIQPVD